MGNDDFAAQGFGEKETVEVRTPFGAARAIVRSSAKVKKGTALLLHAAGSPDGLSLLRPGYAVVPAAIGKGEGQ
jgi:anaerobic selenocysteine-containing dehydrogenase